MTTREEIMQMDAEQLRLAIAAAKGMNPKVVEPWEDIYGITHMSDWCQEERCWLPAGTSIAYNENGTISRLPNWTTSIADAWELWLELPHFKSIENYAPHTEMYYVVFNGNGETTTEVEGVTAPLAICRAWLMWHEEAK